MHVAGSSRGWSLAALALAALSCSSPTGTGQGPGPARPRAAPAAVAEPVVEGPTAGDDPPASPPPTEVAEAPPTDPALLTCSDVRRDIAPGLCGVLEGAPRAAASSPEAKSAVAVWQKLEPAVRSLSGRETALVVLAPDARMGEGDDAEPLPPAAFICPGAPPAVYVPHTLLELVGKKRGQYPDDFLAFVLGHELGHRMNDLTADGCQLAAFQRPGKGFEEEELADARSAFFIANAGYSASDVARADMVSAFLEAEFALGRDDTRSRRDSLLGALRRFDGYEAVYQTALAVALIGDMEAADRLLTWTDERVSADGVPLPELRVVRAIAKINHAATMAPWTAELALPVGIEGLRCTPLHPGHSGLWEEPGKRVRSPDTERGRRLLLEARRLLDEAELRGATPFTVAVARTCAALYLADASEARQQFTRAQTLAPKRPPPAVAEALRDTGALVFFLEYARSMPVPDYDDDEARRTWSEGLLATVGAKAPVPLRAVAMAMASDDLAVAAVGDAAPTCSRSVPAASASLAPLPEPGRQHAACPDGYNLSFALPSADAAATTGTTGGVTGCRSAAGGDIATVRLPATTSPPLEAVARTVGPLAPPAGLETLDAWACGCASLEPAGVSDAGERVFRARCPKVGLPRGALVVAPGKRAGRVSRVIRYSP